MMVCLYYDACKCFYLFSFPYCIKKIIAPVVLLCCKAVLAGCFLFTWANTEKEVKGEIWH